MATSLNGPTPDSGTLFSHSIPIDSVLGDTCWDALKCYKSLILQVGVQSQASKGAAWSLAQSLHPALWLQLALLGHFWSHH